MRADPFFSIIIPTYNRAHLIADTIESLQQQEYDSFEIIVVDDGSTDNTQEVVESVADDRTRYVKKSNAERAAARNFGANLAKGDYVNFFDSDDIAYPNHLSEAARVVHEKQNPEWFHLGYAWATPEKKVFREVNRFTGDTLNDVIANGNPLSCNAVFLRKDIIAAFPFNETRALSASEDYELWVRLAARFPLHFSNIVTSLVIDHEMRSVRTIHGEKLIERLRLLTELLKKDPQVLKYYGKDFRKIESDAYSYVALHLADVAQYKLKSSQYFIKSFIAYPGIVKNRRFYAIIKNLITKWQSS
jgi:glycosyltransferase involved in cell wall biosynthesis